MSITKEKKQELIQIHARKAQDTGSPEVQIAILTDRIIKLTEHFKTHTKDHHSRRGLLILVARRNKLLKYLQKNHLDRYESIIHKLGIRKKQY